MLRSRSTDEFANNRRPAARRDIGSGKDTPPNTADRRLATGPSTGAPNSRAEQKNMAKTARPGLTRR
jgi:hypothetical protein